MNVTNGGRARCPKPLPPERRDLREELELPSGYSRQAASYAAAPGLRRTSRVSGTYNKDITIGADNDIIVTDDFKRGSSHGVLGGLIANNFVRVYHPVNNWNNGDRDCDNNGGPGDITIDAAILALNHSFIVDNWYCGNPTGTLRSRRDRAEVPRHRRHVRGRQHRQRATSRTTPTTTR